MQRRRESLLARRFSKILSNLVIFLFFAGLMALQEIAVAEPVLVPAPRSIAPRLITQAVIPSSRDQNGQPGSTSIPTVPPGDPQVPATPAPAPLPQTPSPLVPVDPSPPSPKTQPAVPQELPPTAVPPSPTEPRQPSLAVPSGPLPAGPPTTQQPPPPFPRRQSLPPPEQPGPPSSLKKPAAKRGEVSFNFDDADVFSVIQTIFGGVLKVNYIIDPKVKGRVNFRSVSPVPKEDVMPLMEVILRLNGIGVIEDGGLYRIIPIGDMPREPAAVGIGRDAGKISVAGLGLLQVVPLKFIPSSEMIRVLTPFLSTNAVMVDVPKINYIIIVDTDANIKRLLQLVEIFDSEQLKQIKPQVFVYPVRNGKAKDVAALLQQIFLGASKTPTPARPATTPARPAGTGQPSPSPAPSPSPQISLGPTAGGEALVLDITRIIPDEVTNTIVILATPDDYALMFETIQKIDIVPRQVMIEVMIAEVTLGDDLRFGIEWSIKAKIDKGFASMGFNTGLDRTTAQGFTFLGIDRTGLIQGFLQALATESKVNVLASPHILAADNREARIQIGNQVPIVTSETPISTIGTTGTSVSRSIQYKDTGVILKIKPLINESGLVSLDLSQEVSDYFLQNIYGSEYPVITKREATTNLVAQDGETIVIGGLIQENFKRTRAGLPLLSKIPLLGWLFSNTTDEEKRTEVIMLLTPLVVKNPEDAKNMTNVYIHRIKGVKKELRVEQMEWYKKMSGITTEKAPEPFAEPRESVPLVNP